MTATCPAEWITRHSLTCTSSIQVCRMWFFYDHVRFCQQACRACHFYTRVCFYQHPWMSITRHLLKVAPRCHSQTCNYLLLRVLETVPFIHFCLFLSTVLQSMQQDICKRLPLAAPHDKPRRERCVTEVQVSGVREGIQIQASPQSRFFSICSCAVVASAWGEIASLPDLKLIYSVCNIAEVIIIDYGLDVGVRFPTGRVFLLLSTSAPRSTLMLPQHAACRYRGFFPGG